MESAVRIDLDHAGRSQLQLDLVAHVVLRAAHPASGDQVPRRPVPALTHDDLAGFLEKAAVVVDRRTPAEMQLVYGPKHLVVYRRSGEGGSTARIHPRLGESGRVRLVDEAGQTVFAGTAKALAAGGISVAIPKWRSRIYSITRTPKAAAGAEE